MTDSSPQQKPLIQLGWLAIGNATHASLVRDAATGLESCLQRQFPEFVWQHEVVEQPDISLRSRAEPLDLLERGVQAKVEQRWDFVLVVTGKDLRSESKPYTFGLPSSALETAVVSTVRLTAAGDAERRLCGLAQFLVGSLLGLDSGSEGAMMEPDPHGKSELRDFSPEDVEFLQDRLRDIADPRLEERKRDWNPFLFRLATLWADPRGILRDVRGYRPWKQPFQLERLTAAAWVSALLAFLGAEVWELGVGCGPAFLGVAAVAAVAITSAFLFSGQNLSSIARTAGLSEQVARSEVVLALCLVTGMTTLWLLLFAGCFTLASVLPGEVIGRWVHEPLDYAARARFAAFVSSLGTLAGGLGGNLEDEDLFKRRFFFDEEV